MSSEKRPPSCLSLSLLHKIWVEWYMYEYGFKMVLSEKNLNN